MKQLLGATSQQVHYSILTSLVSMILYKPVNHKDGFNTLKQHETPNPTSYTACNDGVHLRTNNFAKFHNNTGFVIETTHDN